MRVIHDVHQRLRCDDLPSIALIVIDIFDSIEDFLRSRPFFIHFLRLELRLAAVILVNQLIVAQL